MRQHFKGEMGRLGLGEVEVKGTFAILCSVAVLNTLGRELKSNARQCL